MTVLASTSVLQVLLLAGLLWRRLRLVRLLEQGVVAPAELIARVQLRGTCESARMRTRGGWRTELASYDGPTLRTTMVIGIDGGPTHEVTRTGGEWGNDLCLFDPRRPSRHQFIEDLPPFVGVGADRGWVFQRTERAPNGSWLAIVSGVVALALAPVALLAATVLAIVVAR